MIARGNPKLNGRNSETQIGPNRDEAQSFLNPPLRHGGAGRLAGRADCGESLARGPTWMPPTPVRQFRSPITTGQQLDPATRGRRTSSHG